MMTCTPTREKRNMRQLEGRVVPRWTRNKQQATLIFAHERAQIEKGWLKKRYFASGRKSGKDT